MKEKASAVMTTTKQQATEKCKEYTKNELAASVIANKYLLCDENSNYVEVEPEDMWRRMAKAIVAPEKPELQEELEKRFAELLCDFKFVPAGRIMYGLGNRFVNVTLKNCYVIGIEEDSVKGIFDMAYRAAETYKAGGGVGSDISILRPKGSPIRNAARYSSGSISFMDFFSRITGLIGQKARIGAMLLSMDVSHPDIIDFIEIKSKNNDDIRFANISVKITDEFMRAVEADKDFDLKFNNKIYKTVKAREIWDKIIECAWKRGEPGLLFWDKIITELPAQNYHGFETITTNPCLTGDMKLLTSEGYRTMRELWQLGGYQEYDNNPSIQKHGELKIINNNGSVSATNVYRTSGAAEVYRVTLKNGIYIDATKNHKFVVKGNDSKVPLYLLSIGDELLLNKQESFGSYNYPEYAELAGWVVGDGSISITTQEQPRAYVRTWGSDIDNVLPKLRSLALSVYEKSNKSTNQNPKYDGFDHTPDGFDTPVKEFASIVLGRLMSEDGLVPGNKHCVPQRVWRGNKKTVAAFLRGLFSADGSVQVNERKKCISIRNCQVNYNILKECQLLLNQFGITSTVHFERRKKSKKLMNDGKGGMKLYNKKAEHEIIISGMNNVKKFICDIGFIQEWKTQIANIWMANHHGSNNSEVKFTSEIEKIEYIGIEETFCLTEPINNMIVVNGVNTGNCGETTLSHGDSCNLGSMNLSKYIIKSYTKEAEFDFPSFDVDVRLAIRFLDNIISMEKTPLPFQQEANDKGRRLGLGIMGLADVFLKMGVRYDSEEALVITNKIMSNFMVSSYDASCDLAKEKGVFPVFDAETHFKSEYVKRLPSWLQQKIKATGIRNIALHAIAPTGSLAIVAQCSSGIEPVFQVRHIRKTNLGTAKEVVEHEVLHSVAQEYMEQHNVPFNKLPSYFIGAYDVKPESRIRLQAAIQKYIDQSISNTFNMANDTPKEQIGYYYIEAWKNGLKGITVYREGSREGVLVSADKKEDREQGQIMVHQAPKRPDSIKCKVHSIKPNGKRYTVFVGFLGDRVYEVFALDHGLAGVSDGMEGEIKKDKGETSNQYYFESGCLVVKHLNRYEDKEASLITRLISTSLRHGTPLEFICDQISKANVPVTSLARAIARALSCYIKEEETKGKFKCSVCGSKDIKFEGTCFTCLGCGTSKCG